VRAARARRKALFASGQLHHAVRTGHLPTLNAGIRRLQQAIDALPADDPSRAEFLTALEVAAWRKFELTGALPDLNAAIDIGQQAADANSSDRIPRTTPAPARSSGSRQAASRTPPGRAPLLDLSRAARHL